MPIQSHEKESERCAQARKSVANTIHYTIAPFPWTRMRLFERKQKEQIVVVQLLLYQVWEEKKKRLKKQAKPWRPIVNCSLLSHTSARFATACIRLLCIHKQSPTHLHNADGWLIGKASERVSVCARAFLIETASTLNPWMYKWEPCKCMCVCVWDSAFYVGLFVFSIEIHLKTSATLTRTHTTNILLLIST